MVTGCSDERLRPASLDERPGEFAHERCSAGAAVEAGWLPHQTSRWTGWGHRLAGRADGGGRLHPHKNAFHKIAHFF